MELHPLYVGDLLDWRNWVWTRVRCTLGLVAICVIAYLIEVNIGTIFLPVVADRLIKWMRKEEG